MNPYLHICTDVAEFNYLFEVIDYKYPNNNEIIKNKFFNSCLEYNDKQMKLRHSLINEEIKELQQAIKDNNAIEIVDALCDILYVVAGAKVYFNLPINDYKYEPMTKTQLVAEDLIHIIDELKNTNTKDLIQNIITTNCILENLTDIFINNKNYQKIFLDKLIEMYDNSLNEIVFNIFELASSKYFNFNIVHQFDIVHASNMSKICTNENDAKDSVSWYEVNEPRYKKPQYKHIWYNDKPFFIVFDAETGKIIKSIKYIPAKFI